MAPFLKIFRASEFPRGFAPTSCARLHQSPMPTPEWVGDPGGPERYCGPSTTVGYSTRIRDEVEARPASLGIANNQVDWRSRTARSREVSCGDRGANQTAKSERTRRRDRPPTAVATIGIISLRPARQPRPRRPVGSCTTTMTVIAAAVDLRESPSSFVTPSIDVRLQGCPARHDRPASPTRASPRTS